MKTPNIDTNKEYSTDEEDITMTTLGDLIYEVSNEAEQSGATPEEASIAIGRILAVNGLSEETLY